MKKIQAKAMEILITIIQIIRKKQFYDIHNSAHVGKNVKVTFPENIIINKNVKIGEGVVLQASGKISIGDNTGINPYVVMYGKVKIGKNCMIAPHSTIIGGNHNSSSIKIPMIKQGGSSKGIVIQDDVWIGANAVILDGVNLGKGSIVGAGSVVTKNIKSYEVVAGVPAKKIRSRK